MPATPELLVLTGLAAAGAEQVIAPLRASDPDLAVLHHDLRDAARGVVHRRLRHRGLDEWTTLPPGRADIPRTLCEDVRALARPGAPARILLHLDPVLEPEPVCGALTEILLDGPPVPDLRGVVAVVDVGSWLDDATGDVTPAERGLAALPGDERTLAQVAVGQAELADVVVRTGTADARRARLGCSPPSCASRCRPSASGRGAGGSTACTTPCCAAPRHWSRSAGCG